MPTMPEREARFQAVRGLLRDLAPRFRTLPSSEIVNLTYPRKEPRGEARYAREVKRLPVGAKALFQLHSAEPDPAVEMRTIQSAANAVWGKAEYPKSRWFERKREEFVLGKLAEWIIEHEEAYRESHPPPDFENDPEPHTADEQLPDDRSQNEQEPDEPEQVHPEPIPRDVEDEEIAADDPYEPEPIVLAPLAEGSRRSRPVRVAVIAFAATLIAGALAAAFITWSGAGESAQNPAGAISRVLSIPAPEDLAVADGSVWLVDSATETATRISESNGKPETIFVERPPYVPELMPRSRTGIRLGGYQVVAGPAGRAWVVVNDGTVMAVGPASRRVTRLSRVKVQAGAAVLDRGSLWVGGLGSHPLVRLNARDGKVERKYALHRSGPFPGIARLSAGVGAIWALDYVNERKVYKLTPEQGSLGVAEAVLPLSRPADDLEAGLGAVWTLNKDGTVTRYDPSTGEPGRPIQVPGGAQVLALSQDAVWVGTGNDTAVRIDPITQTVVGKPIKLQGFPVALAADRNVWVATDHKLIEIES